MPAHRAGERDPLGVAVDGREVLGTVRAVDGDDPVL
jgi:hypothetical protein